MEKRPLLPDAESQLPPSSARPQRASPRWRSRLAFAAFGVISLAAYHSLSWAAELPSPSTSASLCAQQAPRRPASSPADANYERLFSAAYRNQSVQLLSGMIQIPTESYDDNGPVGVDKRWEVFYKLADYLEESFPALHATLNLTHVNTHGLLYTWQGSDPSLKPTLLMAHQDVVPVNPETDKDWTHPPYSGHFDGTNIWGRGAVDCKDTLSGLLEAVTLLVEAGWTPRRTVLLSFGFDEESAGKDGAGALSAFIAAKYGPKSIAFLLDEGGLGVGERFGKGFALPGTSEKGYIDVQLTLHTPGGHSSIPPPHTGIGMVSSIVTSLEDDLYTPSLSEVSPILSYLQCVDAHGTISPKMSGLVAQASRKGKKGAKGRQSLAEAFAAQSDGERYLVQTSQAIDVIQGGVKVNALPEVVTLTTNYRINLDQTPQDVKDKFTKHLLKAAKKYNLDVAPFGGKVIPAGSSPSRGVLNATAIGEIKPAPISLTTTAAWDMLSSTIQHSFGEYFPDGLVVSPALDTGNTDVMFYIGHDLSDNLYRFSPSDPASDSLIHTIDEHVVLADHLKSIWFYHELIRNADEADLE